MRSSACSPDTIDVFLGSGARWPDDKDLRPCSSFPGEVVVDLENGETLQPFMRVERQRIVYTKLSLSMIIVPTAKKAAR